MNSPTNNRSDRMAALFGAPYWALTALLFAGVLAMAIWYAPVEKSMGLPQKIFYAHLPVALNTFVAAFVVLYERAHLETPLTPTVKQIDHWLWQPIRRRARS